MIAAAASWELDLGVLDAGTIAPTDELLVAGLSAVAASVAAFAAGRDLDWAEQVVCVATPSAHQQIAALGAAGFALGASCTDSTSRRPQLTT